MTKVAIACIAAVSLTMTSALLAQQRPVLQKADAHDGSGGGAQTCQEQLVAMAALVENYSQQIALLKSELAKLESNDAAEPETR